MKKDQMKDRTKDYANRIVNVCRGLPANWVARTLGMQLLKCGTSVGASYRAACRAKSTADFLNKLKIVEEECDESILWMELLAENGLLRATRLKPLMHEAREILVLVVALAKTARTADGHLTSSQA